MLAFRQYFCLPLFLMLVGCDVTPYIYNESPFSTVTQAKGNAQCTNLFGNAQFNHLKGKMPIMPGEIPTRAMLSVATVPTDREISAIQSLESAVRKCQKLRAAAGMPTSATEDILAARVSKLRYGLYKGEIPYAVYNYGIAQAMRQGNTFMMAGEKAAQEGAVVGGQREQQAIANMQTRMQMNTIISNQHVLNSNQHTLSNFYNNTPSGTWFCKGPSCY